MLGADFEKAKKEFNTLIENCGFVLNDILMDKDKKKKYEYYAKNDDEFRDLYLEYTKLESQNEERN